MLDDFLIRAGLAGLALALAVGPLGAFVVWRRMAYFGDATAHAAILGIALALAFDISLVIGTLAVATAMALTVTHLAHRGHGVDSSLGVMSYGALALGLVAISFLPAVRVDLGSYLFGDILAVGVSDLVVIWGGSLLVLAMVAWRWSALLTATLNEDLAFSAGIDPARERMILTVSLAIVVAVAIKIVGALLIGAMLIIPASAARAFAKTPEGMAIAASGVGVLAVLLGLGGSLQLDTPAGPSIVTAAALLFGASLVLRPLFQPR